MRRLAIAAVLLAAGAGGAAENAPPEAARFSVGRDFRPSPPLLMFTLIDPGTELLPPADRAETRLLASDADLRVEGGATPTPAKAERDLDWRLKYRHSDLSDVVNNATLRGDPSTGFSRQLDRDVVDLGLSWRLADSRLGLGYQLQSARSGGASAASLSRFLPGSAQSTHALTLGVTREFGAGAPPPAAVVAPALDLADSEVTPKPDATPAAP